VVAAVSVLSVLLLASDSALPAVPLLGAVAVLLAAGGSCFEGAPAPAATELCAASASLSRSPAEGRRRMGGRLASAAMACVAASFISSLIALQQQHGNTDFTDIRAIDVPAKNVTSSPPQNTMLPMQ